MYKMDQKLELLDVILTSANAEEYIQTFKQHNITINDMKLLSNEDLMEMGIEDLDIRKNILKNCRELIIDAPDLSGLTVDKKYIKRVLDNIISHLSLHKANLLVISRRQDVLLEDIKLTEACHGLQRCLNDLSIEAQSIEKSVFKSKKSNKKTFIILALTSFGLACVLYKLVRR